MPNDRELLARPLRRPGFLLAVTGAVALQFSLATASIFASTPVNCWDAASEFNDSANPDAVNPCGVWSYGWKKTLTDKFYLSLTSFSDPPNRSGWCNASGYPAIIHNTRPVRVSMSGPNSYTCQSRALSLHPGLDGEYAVLRFSAPADGSYKVSGQFYAMDDNGTATTTDVWILKNNNKADGFSGKVNYHGGSPWVSFTSRSFELKTGDTLDFQVGYGDNKTYFYDSTGFVAIIEKVK